jgi:hypothetical protein
MTVRLVRVVGPRFVAGFESDGVVIRAAPILKALIGMTNAEARAHISAKGWTARIIVGEPEIIQHEESFEVRLPPDRRKFFYYDDNAGRRAVSGRMTKAKALLTAQEWMAQNSRTSQNVTPIKSD